MVRWKEKEGIDTMERMLVISDIHGELEKFERLLEMACYDATRDQLLLLGDYIDRGPHSREVLAKVRELEQLGAIVLMGNHEKMLLDAYRNEEKAVEHWFRNGAKQTLLSYGYAEDEAEGQSAAIRWTEELLDVISFVDKLPYYYETDDYIFVHAGVEPGIPVANCDPHKLVWIRGEFHQGYSGPKTVIFGHSPLGCCMVRMRFILEPIRLSASTAAAHMGTAQLPGACHPGIFIISSKERRR